VLANTQRDAVLAYQRERERIGRLGWEDIRVRMSPPPNPYAADYEALVHHTDALLQGHRLVAYHCTRLTAAEVDDVRRYVLRTNNVLPHAADKSTILLSVNAGRIYE
jgi:hypothetical protein